MKSCFLRSYISTATLQDDDAAFEEENSPLHCSSWEFVSDFYSPHGEIILSFAPLVYEALSDECPAACKRSVQNKGGKSPAFGNFPNGRCSSNTTVIPCIFSRMQADLLHIF